MTSTSPSATNTPDDQTQATSAVLVEADPTTLLIDQNARAVELDRAFLASVKDRGVLVPIVAVRTAEKQLRVRLGHRRTVAAVEAGHPLVRVIVVGDEATDDAGQIDRLVDQYSENEHRAGFKNAERAGLMEQLSAFGLSDRQISKKLKAGPAEVKAARQVTGSEQARDALIKYDLDLTTAAIIAEFDDDPDAVAKLVKAHDLGRVEHTAQELRDERTRQQRRESHVAGLHDQGITVVPNGGGIELTQLKDADGEPLTPESHAQCPGHAAYVTRTYGYVDPATGYPPPRADGTEPDDETEADATGIKTVWSEYPVHAFVCTDDEANGHELRYRRPAATGERVKLADMAPEEAEAARAERRDVIDSNKAWRSAEAVRRRWLSTFLTRKTPPKGTGPLLAAAVANDPETVSRIGGNHLAAKLLGCDTPGYGRSPGVVALVEQASEARAQVIALALVLAGYEDATHVGSWRSVSSSTQRYLTFLATCGYPLSDVERRACGLDPLHADDNAA